MNKRIRELAKEAGLKVESWMTNPPKPFQILGSAEEFEKFANLIIQECATIANRAENNDLEIRCMYNIVTEHFGVKE
jgi:hypothetical protein